MRILGIETSGQACSIALFEDLECVAHRHELVGRGHAERIIPWIAALPDGGRSDRIIVGCGPGSFTGVRVGVAAARALGLGWDVPVDGLASLGLVVPEENAGQLLVAMEGGHGELFVQAFDAGVALGLPESMTPEAAATKFAEALVVGTGAGSLVTARGSGEARPGHADARRIARVSGKSPMLEPRPIYCRAADARPMAAA